MSRGRLPPPFQDPHLVFEDEDSKGHCPAGSEGTEQGEGEGVEGQDHAGRRAERIRKFKRGRADGVLGRDKWREALQWASIMTTVTTTGRAQSSLLPITSLLLRSPWMVANLFPDGREAAFGRPSRDNRSLCLPEISSASGYRLQLRASDGFKEEFAGPEMVGRDYRWGGGGEEGDTLGPGARIQLGEDQTIMVRSSYCGWCDLCGSSFVTVMESPDFREL